MSTVDLERETLTVLPQRLEMNRFAWRSFNTNIAVVNQSNWSQQSMQGCVIGCVQNNVQFNVGIVIQTN